MRRIRSASALGVPLTIALVAVVILAAALSFNAGQNSIRLVTVTDYQVTTQIVSTTVTVDSPTQCCLDHSVQTITLSAATLYASPSSFVFTMNNPGTPTTIDSVQVSGGSLSTSVWTTTGTTTVGNGAASFTYNPPSGSSLSSGSVYNYVINFANGQSISGSLVAQ